MSEELKPCPVCGEDAAYRRINYMSEYYIECVNCYKIKTPRFKTLQDAEDCWNGVDRRPIEDALQKQAERTPQEKAAPEMYQMLERILDYMTGGPILFKPPSVMEIAHLLEEARGER